MKYFRVNNYKDTSIWYGQHSNCDGLLTTYQLTGSDATDLKHKLVLSSKNRLIISTIHIIYILYNLYNKLLPKPYIF